MRFRFKQAVPYLSAYRNCGDTMVLCNVCHDQRVCVYCPIPWMERFSSFL